MLDLEGVEIVVTFSELSNYGRSCRIWHSKEPCHLSDRVPGSCEVFSGSKVHANKEPLDLWAMVDLNPLEGLELPRLSRNLVWLCGQGLVVSDHLLETGWHI